MNTPITWGQYVEGHLLGALAGFVLVLVLSAIARAQRGCRVCARPLHFRWRKPHPLASRRFCPFHDSAEELTR